MNYFLTPQHIAEALNLTGLRKSTPTGLFLLSESDLVAYGLERAKSEGAMELSDNRPASPAKEMQTGEEESGTGGGEPQAESQQEAGEQPEEETGSNGEEEE